ncbi:M3 family metallopeptidase [Lignipirellula cremea]|uniref:oligopeptidase A n=1 Tax=Lignipirellula cremea TaxID=2528010 RepID=A0A518DY95_9BACT|nr:M3 family metallopeptidase [Lignipirellula cremea]QDU96771.1 Oligopeptidase A [Lignipirellula cremea]
MSDNPLMRCEGLPRFDQILPEHVVPAVRAVLAEAEQTLERLEANPEPTWDGIMAPLEAIDLPFEYAWGPVNHLLGVKNSDALRSAHETVLPELVEFELRARQSRPLYEALEKLQASDAWSSLTAAQQRAVTLRLRDAQHSGVGLEGDAKARFNAIEGELSQLGADFSNHLLDATKAFSLLIEDPADTAGWPATLRRITAQSYNDHREESQPAATPENGPWRITLDMPCYIPFMEHSQNRGQREQLYRALKARAASGDWDNTPVLTRILELRREQAQLLGFANYAELSLDSKMAPDAAAVQQMSDELAEAAREHAKIDFEQIKALAAENGQTEPVMHWDVGYWAERRREKEFDFTDEQLRPYFPLPRVLEGLFSLTERLFGVTIAEASDNAPVWHADVRFYRVKNQAGEPVAAFYLDPYSRPAEKRGGAWMDNCLGRRRIAGGLRLPVVYLCCNGTPPVGDTPSLMSFGEVETLFHEFGHGLQGMLTTVDTAEVAGVNGIEWDAVEIASQFMENWCYHKPTLVGLTRHVETGEPLPDELFDKLCAARTFMAGSQFMRQLAMGVGDMRLHTEYDPTGEESPHDLFSRTLREYSVLAPLPDDRSLCSFGHLFAGGYAAGYYSYKWSEVLSADAFGAFEEAGLDNEQALAELGAHYRDTILAQGGSRPPMEVYQDFRGREPNTTALLRHNGLA